MMKYTIAINGMCRAVIFHNISDVVKYANDFKQKANQENNLRKLTNLESRKFYIEIFKEDENGDNRITILKEYIH